LARAATFWFASLAIIPFVVAILYSIGQALVVRFEGEPDRISALVQTRDIIEHLIDPFTKVSIFLWIGAILILGLIWYFAACSPSIRRWRQALSARRAAYAAAAASLTFEELLAEASQLDPAGVEITEQEINQLNTSNRLKIIEIETAQAVAFTSADGEKHVVSIAQIGEVVESLERDIAAALASVDDVAPPDILSLSGRAAFWREQRDHLSQQAQVPLLQADGTTRTVTLADARASEPLQPSDCRPKYEALLVSARTAEHNADALSRNRAAPETFREWCGAVLSGRLAVAATTAIGALAARGAQVGLLAGFLGLSVASANFGGLITQAQSLELTLAVIANDALLEEAIAKHDPPPAQGCESTPAECPSDENVANQLRLSFRSLAAEVLRQNFSGRVDGGARSLHKAAYELAAIDARRQVLAASAREAVGAAEADAIPERFALAPNDVIQPGTQPSFTDPLDDAFKRRIERLRQNEPVWSRLRVWASTPAPADLAGEALIRTTLGQVSARDIYSVRIWSEQLASTYAGEIVAHADPFEWRRAVIESLPGNDAHITARDRRLVGDIIADAPETIERRLHRFRDGFEDPGSLMRVATPDSHPPTPGSGNPDTYGESFPAHSKSEGGGLNTIRSPRLASRSYAQVRFSGRVGGVVIGRDPEANGILPDVVAFTWTRSAEGMRLLVRRRDGAEVALGPYSPAIVHQALAFAADGRTVVATISLTPLQLGGPASVKALRVVVHPAFEDTAFGCSAIDIDHFVFRFIDARIGNTVESAVFARIELARNGVAALRNLLDSGLQIRATDEQRSQWTEQLLDYAHSCNGDAAQCFPVHSYQKMDADLAAEGLKTAAAQVNCAASAADVAAFNRCMFDKPNSGSFGWGISSGVREQAYRIDPDLAFITGRGAERDELWPLGFVLQVVPETAKGEDLAGFNFTGDPWNFPTIANDVETVVRDRVSHDAKSAEIFHRFRDFAVLQRLFRTAFSGNLGIDFPLATLARLSEGTAKDVRPMRTEKWDNSGGFLNALDRDVTNLLKDMILDEAISQNCRSTIQKSVDNSRQMPWPGGPGVWPFLSRLQTECPSSGDSVAQLQQIRDELYEKGLLDEMIAVASGRSSQSGSCPAP
jgi:hypothetical protein